MFWIIDDFYCVLNIDIVQDSASIFRILGNEVADRRNNKHFANNWSQWTIKNRDTTNKIKRNILIRWKISILDMIFIFSLRLFGDIFFFTPLLSNKRMSPQCDVWDVERNWCNIVRKAKLNALLIPTSPCVIQYLGNHQLYK